ncbi:MAG: DUF4156 domain-containing protein [Burkholderiaceae bacterium]
MKKQRITGFAVFAITLGVMGCATTETTSKGATVEIVTERPTGCRLLGEAVGKQGNAFTGDFISNENLMIGARNDLKNKAAAMGATWYKRKAHCMEPTHTAAVRSAAR